jgi:hypothetical protein
MLPQPGSLAGEAARGMSNLLRLCLVTGLLFLLTALIGWLDFD